jgi:hypothetical protein
MGFLDGLNTVLEGLATVGQNSYTQEEKELINKTRDLMRAHGRTEAAEALDAVINDFYKGITRTATTTSTSTTTSSTTTSASGQVMSTAEFVYELKNRIKKSYSTLDTVIVYEGNTIRVDLRLISSVIASYKITNGNYQGCTTKRSAYLYNKEIAACEADLIQACREIRSL